MVEAAAAQFSEVPKPRYLFSILRFSQDAWLYDRNARSEATVTRFTQESRETVCVHLYWPLTGRVEDVVFRQDVFRPCAIMCASLFPDSPLTFRVLFNTFALDQTVSDVFREGRLPEIVAIRVYESRAPKSTAAVLEAAWYPIFVSILGTVDRDKLVVEDLVDGVPRMVRDLAVRSSTDRAARHIEHESEADPDTIAPDTLPFVGALCLRHRDLAGWSLDTPERPRPKDPPKLRALVGNAHSVRRAVIQSSLYAFIDSRCTDGFQATLVVVSNGTLPLWRETLLEFDFPDGYVVEVATDRPYILARNSRNLRLAITTTQALRADPSAAQLDVYSQIVWPSVVKEVGKSRVNEVLESVGASRRFPDLRILPRLAKWQRAVYDTTVVEPLMYSVRADRSFLVVPESRLLLQDDFRSVLGIPVRLRDASELRRACVFVPRPFEDSLVRVVPHPAAANHSTLTVLEAVGMVEKSQTFTHQTASQVMEHLARPLARPDYAYHFHWKQSVGRNQLDAWVRSVVHPGRRDTADCVLRMAGSVGAEECPVCYGAVTSVFLSRCGHSVCQSCMVEWAKSSRECPVCSAESLAGVEDRCVVREVAAEPGTPDTHLSVFLSVAEILRTAAARREALRAVVVVPSNDVLSQYLLHLTPQLRRTADVKAVPSLKFHSPDEKRMSILVTTYDRFVSLGQIPSVTDVVLATYCFRPLAFSLAFDQLVLTPRRERGLAMPTVHLVTLDKLAGWNDQCLSALTHYIRGR